MTERPAEGPGAPAASARWYRRAADTVRSIPFDGRVVLLLLVAFLLLRWPFRAEFLVNWDAVNFALGIDKFDLQHHQPHPPGYIGYVVLGRLVSAAVGSVNGALTTLSVLAGAAVPALYYPLARRFMTRRSAVVTAVLLGASPVVWYYSVVALSYIVAAAIVVPLVWAAHVARRTGSLRHLLLASGLLALLGAVRQTDMVFLLPLWLYAARPFAWAARRRAALLLGAATLLWLVPLVWLSDGPIRYLRAAASLAEFAGGRTWLPALDLAGIAQNVGLVALGLLLGLNVALLAVFAALRHRAWPLAALDRDDRRFVAAWLVPALLAFVLVHTGQIGYVLLLLPAAFLLLGIATERLVEVRRERRAPPPARALRPAAVRLGVALGIGAQAFSFFAYPEVGRGLLQSDDAQAVSTVRSQFVEEPDAALARTRQYDLGENDRHWGELTENVRLFEPGTSVILALPASGGSFRHLAFYTPEYLVYGLGEDRNGRFGHLATAHGGDSNYEVDRLDRASGLVPLPPDVRRVVITDSEVAERLAPDIPRTISESESGVRLVVVPVGPDAVLRFEQEPDDPGRLLVTTSAILPGAYEPRHRSSVTPEPSPLP